ncbi:hypothetical protein LptCag_0114 [Leptospirillum ferriphilum]|uniref:Uncharacterized protein n=1 Tax=Leptospirillum ferriphilum TaxID=178606 RepID=A0A094YJZ9_9BACT|nr:hypothetical protein LptCag_0114 [Leptospirillum ferriphilum]
MRRRPQAFADFIRDARPFQGTCLNANHEKRQKKGPRGAPFS